MRVMNEDRQPSPLLAPLGRLLEAALNRALDLDAATRAQLGALEGRRVGIELRGTPIALAVEVRDGKLQVGPHWQAPADLDVRGGPGSLLAFALRRGDAAGPPSGRVQISGDAELAQRFQKLVRDFAPDVEEAFARAFGDVVGVPLARAVRGAFDWSRESVDALARDSAGFLRDETRDLVAPAEIDAFLDEVDALRERVGRLAARVANLSARGGTA